MTTEPIQLPALEEPCPDCPTAEDRKAANDAWQAWADEKDAAWIAYIDSPGAPRWNQVEAWALTPEYKALEARRPEYEPEVGCPECDWNGTRPTVAGKAILDFVRKWKA